ncbi:MAG: AraC family transcriptional regulator [Pseudomonadota bacterium]
MLSFSTDDLRPQDRFDHWCEVRAKALFGVTIELESERRAAFRGRFRARPVGTAVVSDMQASSYRISRTATDIANRPGHSLCISLQIRGPGWLDVGRRPYQRIEEGQIVISHSDMPFQGTPERTDGFQFRMVKIPLTADLLLDASAADLYPAHLPHSAPYARPLAAMFAALTRSPEEIIAPTASVAHAAHLALLARGRLSPRSLEGRLALRAGYLEAAREIMVRDLGRPSLSPATVASELSISVRQVHVLFEPTGLSFSRTLMAMRIKEAVRLLHTEPQMPITAVAFASGFESLSTFYRAFQKEHALPPRAQRTTASRPRGSR